MISYTSLESKLITLVRKGQNKTEIAQFIASVPNQRERHLLTFKLICLLETKAPRKEVPQNV